MDALYNQSLDKMTEGHVFYEFKDEETYINNLISFIKSGLKNKQPILIIESMRILPKIRERIDMFVNDEQKSTIRLVNNFEYYLSKGDFHTPTIINYFQKDLSSLSEFNSSIRTWAHVEWTSSEPDTELLKEFESTANDFVIEENILSVCAYSSTHLSQNMTVALEELHQYVMTDESFSVSSLYSK